MHSSIHRIFVNFNIMASINNFIFWTKNYLFRPNAIKQYKASLVNIENDSNLKTLNWKKRVSIIRYAYNNIPFYKKYYDDNGFHPNMLKSENDWNLVPILEKKYIKHNLNELLSPQANNKYLETVFTGGSTGTPLKFYTDKRFCKEIQAWRMFKIWGISPADNHGIVHRRVPTSLVPKLKNRILWYPTKRIYLNVCSLTEEIIKNFVEELISNKIIWIQGYVGGLEQVADFILKYKYKITSLKLVWSTSAPLSKNVRLKMEQAFNCKVMNQYGCTEVWNIAMGCPNSDNMHISFDYVHVDIIDNHNKNIFNKEGDILITDLENYICPLIKYRLGDRGTLLSEKCICGNPLPILRPVKGRISDSIYTPKGLYISGEYLTTLFDDFPLYYSQYQIYQHSDFSIDINVVLAMNNNNDIANDLKRIKDILIRNTNNEIPIKINIVENIKDDKGKIRYILSEIAIKKYRSDLD